MIQTLEKFNANVDYGFYLKIIMNINLVILIIIIGMLKNIQKRLVMKMKKKVIFLLHFKNINFKKNLKDYVLY